MATPGSREGAGALVSNSVQRAIQEREHRRLRASGQLHREAMLASMTRSEMVDLWRMQDPAGNAPVKLDEFTGAGICSAPRDQREGQPPYGHDAQCVATPCAMDAPPRARAWRACRARRQRWSLNARGEAGKR